MPKIEEKFKSDPVEEKHMFLAVDDQAYCPCFQSFVSDSRSTEGRQKVLHTLHKGSIQSILQDLICGECQTILAYGRKKHGLFCLNKERVFTRELLDSLVRDTCGTGISGFILFLGFEKLKHDSIGSH